MTRSRLPGVARLLAKEVPDADLLERYAIFASDEAFAQLVARYSRLVWGQCRNLLSNDADADDAFQATFLTLARSVRKLRRGAPLGPWLHGVAYRVCMNARRAKARRTKREKASAVSEAARPVADSEWELAFAAVAEEVQKLPEGQRVAFVLCGLEGRSESEAATALGQKVGTISSRLARAKQTLLKRLAQRGLGAGVLALGGITGSVAVAPAASVTRTLALLPSGAAVPNSIQGLMQGVTGMTMMRIKLLAAGVMVATGLGLSVGGGWSNEATAQGPGPTSAAPPAKADPGIEKLKADLEKAKAELLKAEMEVARQIEREALTRRAEREKLDRLTAEYEYEPAPKGGLTAKEFEAKLTEREKAGWGFVGEVAIRGKDDPAASTLVFRKARRMTTWIGEHKLDSLNGSGVEYRLLPAAPKPPDAPRPVDPAAPKFAPPALGPNPGLTERQKLLQWDIDQRRIADLEKLVAELRVGKPAPGEKTEKEAVASFTAKDFGAWDAKELAAVLAKLLADDAKANNWKIQIVLGSDGVTAKGTPEAVAGAIAWMKKLKK